METRKRIALHSGSLPPSPPPRAYHFVNICTAFPRLVLRFIACDCFDTQHMLPQSIFLSLSPPTLSLSLTHSLSLSLSPCVSLSLSVSFSLSFTHTNVQLQPCDDHTARSGGGVGHPRLPKHARGICAPLCSRAVRMRGRRRAYYVSRCFDTR